jgi:type IV pilus assembly protein PilC
MSLFHYKAIDAEGKTIEGDLEAESRIDLAHTLKKDNVSLISVSEKKQSSLNININLPFIGGVKAHDKITFARNLGSMIEAGLPMTRALSIMERQASGELKKILVKLGEDVSTGQTLSQAMLKYPKVFSQLFVSMVKAGEESGNLTMALKNVALQMEKSYLLTKKVKGAMMYPAVILSLMVVIGTLMMIYVVPTLSSTFESLGAQLPLGTRIIIAISNGLKDYIVWVILIVAVLVGVLTWAFRTPRGARLIDWTMLRLPVIGEITREVNSARTARTLSSLIFSGVDIVVALAVTRDVMQNSYYKDVLTQVEAVIQKGEPISKIFSANPRLYPIFVGEMVAVGEETGKIGDMLLGVAEYYEEDVDQKTKDMSAIIEPLLMIVIGAGVGIFAISMISPIYSLSSVIQ